MNNILKTEQPESVASNSANGYPGWPGLGEAGVKAGGGVYFENENTKLYSGDCMEVMKSLGGVDLIVTDPPYFLPATHYNVRSGSSKSIGDLSILEYYFKDVFSAMASCLRDTGFCYIFCDGQSYPIFHRVGYSIFKKARPLIWNKKTSINGYSWRHQHEIIMFCEMMNSPAIPTGDGDVLDGRAVPIKQRKHLAQKPIDLLKRLIEKSTSEGDTVLDPFMGSGATIIAANQLGRKAIGIEIEEKYCAIAKELLNRKLFGE